MCNELPGLYACQVLTPSACSRRRRPTRTTCSAAPCPASATGCALLAIAVSEFRWLENRPESSLALSHRCAHARMLLPQVPRSPAAPPSQCPVTWDSETARGPHSSCHAQQSAGNSAAGLPAGASPPWCRLRLTRACAGPRRCDRLHVPDLQRGQRVRRLVSTSPVLRQPGWPDWWMDRLQLGPVTPGACPRVQRARLQHPVQAAPGLCGCAARQPARQGCSRPACPCSMRTPS